MTQELRLLYFGTLLHDVGKVLYRSGMNGDSHASLGADFLEREIAPYNLRFADEAGCAIVEQVRYHHDADNRDASISGDSLAHITRFADSVANAWTIEDEGRNRLGSERRDAELRKIFNTLRGHADSGTIAHEDYGAIIETMRNGLTELDVSDIGLVRLCALLEDATGRIPASTNPNGLIDVSLYDHAMTTAGIAACVYEYLAAHGASDYREALFGSGACVDARDTEMFLLYSCDMSGIQSFIYNISGDGALKQLRARSLYLELLLEHIADDLLQRLDLCRANLLYTGGGHAYLLLPNTQKTLSVLRSFGVELEAWFIDHYRTDLYVASAWVPCCANDLANSGEDRGRYPSLYRKLTRGLSEAKASRYDARTLRKLNFGAEETFDHSRECSECHRSDLRLDKDGKCSLCSSLGAISASLVGKDVFVVERESTRKNAGGWRPSLALPFGCGLRVYSQDEYRQNRYEAVRIYAKCDIDEQDISVTRIKMGDYTADTNGIGLAAYAEGGSTLGLGKGIKRLGVLRADVDDLGSIFVAGLPEERVSISRTSTLSRSLSLFFKSKVNEVLQHGEYQAQIIYSGGDDLFIVGNWNDVIYAAVDIREALDAYTENGTLTISGGIGMFGKTYPIARMAAETGELEDAAKSFVDEATGKTKNAIALWSRNCVFGWDEFIHGVMPRMRKISKIFETSQKGSSLLYRIVNLLRSYDSVASAPRLAYLLARSFEDDKEHGNEKCRLLYELAQDPQERRQLVTALEWYACSVREGRDE